MSQDDWEHERKVAIHRERGIEERSRNQRKPDADGVIRVDVNAYIRRHENMHRRLADKGFVGQDELTSVEGTVIPFETPYPQGEIMSDVPAGDIEQTEWPPDGPAKVRKEADQTMTTPPVSPPVPPQPVPPEPPQPEPEVDPVLPNPHRPDDPVRPGHPDDEKVEAVMLDPGAHVES